MEASQVDARQRVRADMEVFSQTLAASSLTEACYHKIHRLHDDKVRQTPCADSAFGSQYSMCVANVTCLLPLR